MSDDAIRGSTYSTWTLSGGQPSSTGSNSAVTVTIPASLTRTEPTFWLRAQRVVFTVALMHHQGAAYPIFTGLQLAAQRLDRAPAYAHLLLRAGVEIPEPEEGANPSFDDELANALRGDRTRSASTASAVSAVALSWTTKRATW